MDDIRMLEDQIKQELDQKMSEMGMKIENDTKSTGSIKSTPY
jgi:hypothetical protein